MIRDDRQQTLGSGADPGGGGLGGGRPPLKVHKVDLFG